MDQGDQLLAKGDLQGSLKRYRAAHQIMNVPTTGIEVAQVQEKLGLLVEARATAIEVANSVVAAKEPEVFAQARAAAAELASSLHGRIASVTIEIGPSEANTTTKIGDAVVPPVALGLPYKINPGKHVLSVTAPGYAPQEVNFQMAEGEERALRLVLAPDNNVAISPRPPDVSPVSEPSQGNSNSVAIDNGPDAVEGGVATRTWVAFGVAAAAGLLGGGAGVYSLIKTNDAKDRCDGNVCPAGVRDTIEGAKTLAWVANVGLGVAVLAAGYGVYTLISDRDGGEAAAAMRTRQQQASGFLDGGRFGIALSPHGDSGAVTWTGAF